MNVWAPLRRVMCAAATMASLGCVTDGPSSVCERLCANLDECGMLPSWFGQSSARRETMVDCETRCSLSSNLVLVYRCFDIGDPDIDPWCPTSVCAEARECLLDHFVPQALGLGLVRFSWYEVESASETEPPLGCPAAQEERPSGSGGLASLCAASFDTVDAPTTVSVSLETEDKITELAAGSCSQIFGRSLVETNIPVGVYTPAVTVRNESTQTCAKFYHPPILIEAFDLDAPSSEAATEVDFTFIAPANGSHLAYPCETCDGDTEDRDGDGLIGCFDPDCASVCDEALNCADGIDNDGNGLVDCSDPACSVSVTCP